MADRVLLKALRAKMDEAEAEQNARLEAIGALAKKRYRDGDEPPGPYEAAAIAAMHAMNETMSLLICCVRELSEEWTRNYEREGGGAG